MPELLKSVLIGSSLLIAAPALAEDPVVEGEASATTGDGTTVNADGSVNADPNATGTVDATATGNVMMGWWPQSAVDRPFMRGKGKITAGGDYTLYSFSFPNPITMMNESIRADGISLNAAYGVSDQINVGANYLVGLGAIGDNEFNAAGPFKNDIYRAAAGRPDHIHDQDRKGETIHHRVL